MIRTTDNYNLTCSECNIVIYYFHYYDNLRPRLASFFLVDGGEQLQLTNIQESGRWHCNRMAFTACSTLTRDA